MLARKATYNSQNQRRTTCVKNIEGEKVKEKQVQFAQNNHHLMVRPKNDSKTCLRQ